MARKMKFIREDYTQLSGLGLRRKKLWKYRKATGLDNKVRLKIKGHYRNVSIGFGSERKSRGQIKGLKPVLVHNLEEIKKLNKNETGILANIGSRKKIEIANYVIENKIKLVNFNAQKFLEQEKEIKEKKREEKISKMDKKEEKRKEELQKEKLKEENEKSEKKETIDKKIEEKEIENVEKEVAEKIAEEVQKKDEGKENEKTEVKEEKKIVKRAVKKIEKEEIGGKK